jgi:hypothetical protein
MDDLELKKQSIDKQTHYFNQKADHDWKLLFEYVGDAHTSYLQSTSTILTFLRS